jgi:hypothetical protein
MTHVLRNLGRDFGLRCVEHHVGAVSLVISRRAHLFLILFVLAVYQWDGCQGQGRNDVCTFNFGECSWRI